MYEEEVTKRIEIENLYLKTIKVSYTNNQVFQLLQILESEIEKNEISKSEIEELRERSSELEQINALLEAELNKSS